MTYQAIIFDLDGTLVDTLGDLTNSVNFALEQFGQPGHSPQACRQMIGNGFKVFVEKALALDKQHLRDEVVLATRRHYMNNCFEYSRLYDGIADTVKRLVNKGIRLAVLTNKDQNIAIGIVEHFFSENTFEHVVGTIGDEVVKPDIAATMKIVKSMNLGPVDFLFVGDSSVDMKTAARARIRSVGACWGFGGKGELAEAKADVIMDRPEEILDLLT